MRKYWYMGYVDGSNGGVRRIERDEQHDFDRDGVENFEVRATFTEARRDVIEALQARAREYQLAVAETRQLRRRDAEHSDYSDRDGPEW